MLKLSDRLKALADQIKPGERVADIGTDHAQLPIYLTQQGVSPYVVLSDIKRGPLNKARENIALYAPESDFDIRLGDGLATILAGEVDTVIIAGMGGILITTILAADLDKTRSIKKLVLQPRKDKILLSKWLIHNGFQIVDETLVKEGRNICEILVARPFQSNEKKDQSFNSYSDWDYEINPILCAKNDPLLPELINRKINNALKIIQNLKKAEKTPTNTSKTDVANKRLIALKGYQSFSAKENEYHGDRD